MLFHQVNYFLLNKHKNLDHEYKKVNYYKNLSIFFHLHFLQNGAFSQNRSIIPPKRTFYKCFSRLPPKLPPAFPPNFLARLQFSLDNPQRGRYNISIRLFNKLLLRRRRHDPAGTAAPALD